MLKQMTLDEKFLAFLDSKDPHERYDWRDARVCACTQFCVWLYGELPDPNFNVMKRQYGAMSEEERGLIWDCGETSYDRLAMGHCGINGDLKPAQWVFGQLRDRFLASRAQVPA